MSSAQRLAGAIDRLTDCVGRATSWLALFLALVMGANVLLRYGFSLGWIWAQELEWHILAPIVLFGMSYALLHGEHVRVDVVFQSLRPRTKFAIDVVAAALGMGLAAAVIWLSIPYVWQSWSIVEGSPNPGGIDHRYIVKALIPIGFILFFLQSLSQAIKSAAALRSA